MTTQTVSVTLVKITCPRCGVIFGLSERHDEKLRETHDSFYCPNGHSQYFPQKSDTEILRDKLTCERALHDQTKSELEYTERQRRAAKGQLTKTRNRIKNGVCPCCKRTFQDLQRHIKSKHPHYSKNVKQKLRKENNV